MLARKGDAQIVRVLQHGPDTQATAALGVFYERGTPLPQAHFAACFRKLTPTARNPIISPLTRSTRYSAPVSLCRHCSAC